MVKWSAVLLAIDDFQCHNLFTWWMGQVGTILSPSYTSPNLLVLGCCSLCNMPKYVDFSVPGLQSGSPGIRGMNQ